MRKKYLSALLFGALLVTSAGTFTSCKDYDDEINGLQEQIDEIKTTLSELEKQIGTTGVSSVTFDEATGVLTVVDGNGTKTYKIQTTAEAKVEAVIKDGVLIINDKEIGKVGGDEVKVEDGKLKVNGDVVYEFGPEVVLVKNLDNGTCTLSVGDETVTLPLASSTGLVSLNLTVDGITFGSKTTEDKNTNSNVISWGLASDNVESQGVKGNITKGQFLVGQIEATKATLDGDYKPEGGAVVTVLPASYDLSAQSLTLRDSKGNKAPVYVKALASNGDDLVIGSRAADSKGEYNLAIEFTDDVTKDNVADVFKSNGKSILYALYVNGVQYSDYSIAVKTDADKSNNVKISYDKLYLFNGNENGYYVSTGSKNYIDLEIGETKLNYKDANLYDSYITFEGTNKALARELGVEANGMTITASDKAKGTKNLVATINFISVTGATSTGTIYLNFAGTSIDTPIDAEAVTYKVDATGKTKDLFLKVDGLFANLSDAELEKVNANSQITLAEVDGQEGFLIENVTSSNYTFLKADKRTEFNAAKDDLNELAYVKINDAINYANDAEEGDYKLTLTVKDNGTNPSDLVKINIPVKVTLPAFDELFTKSDKWKDGVYNATLFLGDKSDDASNGPCISFTNAFKAADGVSFDTDFTVEIDKLKNAAGADVTPFVGINQGSVELAKGMVENNALIAKDIKVQATYNLGGKLDVKSDKFTTHLISIFEGAELVYYKAGKDLGYAEVGADNTIAKGANLTDASKKAGLVLKYGTNEIPVCDNMTSGLLDFNIAKTHFNSTTDLWNSSYSKYIGAMPDVPSLPDITPEYTSGGVFLKDMQPGDASKLVVTFTDVMGIKTTAEIEFK